MDILDILLDILLKPPQNSATATIIMHYSQRNPGQNSATVTIIMHCYKSFHWSM